MPPEPIHPSTHPAAFAYAVARCAVRKVAARYATKDEQIQAQRAAANAFVAACRAGERNAARRVRNAILADLSLTDPGIVMARASEQG